MSCTRAELARLLGVSRAAISAAIRTGRIPAELLNPDTSISNPERAAAAFLATTRRHHQQPHPYRLPMAAWAPPATPAPAAPVEAAPVEAADPPDRHVSAARREAARARAEELRLAEIEGRLVDKGDVMSAAAQAGRMVRDRLLAVPSRVCGQIAVLDDPNKVRWLLQTEIEQALESLSESGDGLIRE